MGQELPRPLIGANAATPGLCRSIPVVSSGTVRQKWLMIILGPSLLLVAASAATLVFLPHPVPRTATGAQRVYLVHCASCHGADGRGSWRSTLFLARPGDLSRPETLGGLTDDYLLTLIKNGGAPLGKPGMPAFGFHLSDGEIRDLIAYVRALPARPPPRSGSAPEVTAASGSR
jgi:mono/diheme cytochrome c family protein